MLAAHQTDAAARVVDLLERRRAAILADDVGLGKSYIAAEVMRGFAAVDLIVPAALVEQWRDTLRQFDVDAKILTHDALVRDPFVACGAGGHCGEAGSQPAVGSPGGLRARLSTSEPPAAPQDRLVVVDEAHAFRNPRTQRYAALARRTIAARVLLVTATPVCNGLHDLEALVRLIARDDALADAGVPSIDVAFETRDRELIAIIVAALVVRRDRSVLAPELQFGALDRRVLRHPVLDARGIDLLEFPLVGDSTILRRFLWRRLESSEAALTESLRRQRRFYDRALAAIAAGRTLPKRDYRLAFAHEEDRDAFQEVLFWDLFAPAGDADPHAIREEIARLEALIEAARASPCIKRNMLRDLVRDEREPMLIFTGSAATARDLHDALKDLRRCGLVTSRERSREAVLHAFRSGHLDVVVSTDMAAEGLNLQRAGVVVHYDIPWNPVKLDQRNGRAHRIGQKRESVKAIYFLPESRETKIVETVARKNRVRRRALQPSRATARDAQPTLRPRVGRDAAILRLDLDLPEQLDRRHKAGIEMLIEEMSREYIDEARIAYLVSLVSAESCGAAGFSPLKGDSPAG